MSSTIFFFLFIPLLAFILLSVNLIFAPHNPYMEKNSAFECGFSSFLGQNRTQFSISFFVFALLFLLFDLEILLVYPYLVSAYTNGVYGLVIMLMFLLALTLGFAFELGKKALSIDSRQMSNVVCLKKSNYENKVNAALSPFINIKKRSYSTSNNKVNFEVVFYIVKFIWFLYSLAKLIINLFRAPVSFIYNYIWNEIVGVITYSIESSYHYRVLKIIYSEYDFTYSLILSALFIRHSFLSFLKNKHNILNILCFFLACLYGVYNINFVIFSFFLLSSIAILLVLSIITNLTILYIDKPKGLNLLLAYLCFGVLVLLLGVVLFYLYVGYLEYVLDYFNGSNEGPSGPEGPQGSSGPEGPGGPGKPPWNPGSVISWYFSRKEKREKEKREKETREKEKWEEETYSTSTKDFDKAGWHLGETPSECRELQDLIFENKKINPINTGEDSDFNTTSTPEEQQAMDKIYKATGIDFDVGNPNPHNLEIDWEEIKAERKARGKASRKRWNDENLEKRRASRAKYNIKQAEIMKRKRIEQNEINNNN